jgi:hypothetical protein
MEERRNKSWMRNKNIKTSHKIRVYICTNYCDNMAQKYKNMILWFGCVMVPKIHVLKSWLPAGKCFGSDQIITTTISSMNQSITRVIV